MVGNKDDNFEKVYKTYYRDIFRYVYRIVQDKQTAEDITQDVFCAALHLGNEFLNHPNREGWLMVAAKNKLSEMHRRKKYRMAQSLDEKLELEAWESGFREIDLEQSALCVLRKEEWEMVKGYYMGETAIKELAEKYGVTENNMRVRLYRLKVKVRKAIE